MPDERRRFDSRRPSDAEISAGHKEAIRRQQLAEVESETERALAPPEPAGGDAAPSPPDPVAPHGYEPAPGHSPEREQVRRALRRLAKGRWSGRGRFSDVEQGDELERIRRVVGPPLPHEEPGQPPEPEGVAERRERLAFLKARGVDVDGADLVMWPVAPVGQGHTRTTFPAFPGRIEHDHTDPLGLNRRRGR
jgi:hypothetical protein